jgi:hypothetical protein
MFANPNQTQSTPIVEYVELLIFPTLLNDSDNNQCNGRYRSTAPEQNCKKKKDIKLGKAQQQGASVEINRDQREVTGVMK